MKDKNSKLYRISVAICSVIVTAAIGYLLVRAGDFNPGSGPTAPTMKTLEDIYCKQLYGCTSTSYTTDSPASPTSTMYNLTAIYDQVPAFPNQEHQRYDDWNCANNNAEASSTCDAGDPEYVGEEAIWSSSTDSSLDGALVVSGKVYKDERNGLYWSDAYDSTSGGGSPNFLTNQFGTTTEQCGSDEAIINGTCDPCTWTTKGAAIAFCCDLSLDSNGDGTDETDWRLPTQKELMQAYIDGAANNLQPKHNRLN
ncbi:unnamed protein product, partial [marine sediment metagenome]